MKLTVVDTPGFGDQINNDNWWVYQLLDHLSPYKCRNHCLVLPKTNFHCHLMKWFLYFRGVGMYLVGQNYTESGCYSSKVFFVFSSFLK